METLGPMVRRTREHKGIRAADLAYRIGKDPSYLSRLERNLLKELPTPEVLVALARELAIPEVQLLHALGFLKGEAQPRPTYGDTRLQILANEWDEMSDAEKTFCFGMVAVSRNRRGLPDVDDAVAIVSHRPSKAALG